MLTFFSVADALAHVLAQSDKTAALADIIADNISNDEIEFSIELLQIFNDQR